MNEQRNLILAAVLSVGILFGFDYFFGTLTPQAPAPEAQTATQTLSSAPQAPGQPALPGESLPAIPGSAPNVDMAVQQAQARASALTNSPRITIDSPRIGGSIALKGGRIDDIARSVRYGPAETLSASDH